MPSTRDLSRRERQIMDAVYRMGQATAAQVRESIPEPPTANAVRRLLSILVEKGHLRRRWEGPLQVFRPVVPKARARESALAHLKRTFFDDSAARAMAALLDGTDALTDAELDELQARIEAARRRRPRGES